MQRSKTSNLVAPYELMKHQANLSPPPSTSEPTMTYLNVDFRQIVQGILAIFHVSVLMPECSLCAKHAIQIMSRDLR